METIGFECKLQGKRIIVTGASSGIGRALAERLASERARLVLASRDAERLESLAGVIRGRAGEAYVVPTDVAEANQRAALIAAALDRLGGLDVLVNNAGVGAMGLFEDASEERLRRIFEVNFFGTTELTRLALPHLRQGREPLIVNIGSVLGKRAIPGCTEYCASKFCSPAGRKGYVLSWPSREFTCCSCLRGRSRRRSTRICWKIAPALGSRRGGACRRSAAPISSCVPCGGDEANW